jgi:hypothetical protein
VSVYPSTETKNNQLGTKEEIRMFSTTYIEKSTIRILVCIYLALIARIENLVILFIKNSWESKNAH